MEQMQESEIKKIAEELRTKAGTRKSAEKEDLTIDRLKKALSPRDEAMRKIAEYQAKVGEPSEDEVNDHFFNN